jgi:hypothetical protein
VPGADGARFGLGFGSPMNLTAADSGAFLVTALAHVAQNSPSFVSRQDANGWFSSVALKSDCPKMAILVTKNRVSRNFGPRRHAKS